MSAMLALVLLVFPGNQLLCRAAQAEEIRPMMVVSIAGSDKLLSDIVYLTDSSGYGDFGRFVALMASPYTATLDASRPAGVYVTMEEGQQEPVGVSFLPVKDLKALLETLAPQVGQPEEKGDGVLAIATDRRQPLFVKQVGKWAFLSNDRSALNTVPENPAKLLGDLPKQYTIAVRVTVPNIPASLRMLATDKMRQGFEEGFDSQLDGESATEARRVAELGMQSIVDLIEDANELTLGWQVDAETEKTYLDVSLTALRGTELAKQMANAKESESSFSGFQRDDAAMTFHAHGTSTEQEIEQAVFFLAQLRTEAMKKIDKKRDLSDPADREKVKTLVGQLLDIAVETIEAGKMDCGATIMLRPESLSFVAGGFISDGQKLAATLKDLAIIAEEKDPNFPGMDFDTAEYKGVTLHTARVPVRSPKPEARELLGDPMDVVIGTGDTSAYLAFGKDASELLKQVLDDSQTSDTLLPGSLIVSLTPILNVAAEMEGNPKVKAALEAVKETGNDEVSITVLPIKRGVKVRLEVQSGVLKAVGAASKPVPR